MKTKMKIDLGASTEKSDSIIAAAEDFVRQCVLPQAPPQQHADIMLAFMAGAFSLYSIQMSPNFITNEKDALGKMERIHNELREFFEPMKADGSDFSDVKTGLSPNIKKDLG